MSRELTINALENGRKIESLSEFLQSLEEQFLPETVEGFLRETEKRAAALKDKGKAIKIECEKPEIADEIAANPNSKKLCQRFGKKSLVVSSESAMTKKNRFLKSNLITAAFTNTTRLKKKFSMI